MGDITTNDQTKMIERCKHVSLVYQIKQNICLFIFITFYNISILNKGENATPELFAINIQNDAARKTNESVSKCSKTGLCITVNVLWMLS